MEKVSIILPVFNVEKYLGDCLDSLVNQTYQNLEIIIVDDGSPDSSGMIADQYADQDGRIRVIHKENGGVASARNAGLKMADGDYVIFVDPDDWVSEDHVEYLIHLQKLRNADLCMTTQLYTQKGEGQTKDFVEKTISNEDAAALLLSPDIYVGSYGKLYRRKWLIENNIWQNESIYSGEGLHFTVTAAQKANLVTISNKKIYFYRRNVPQSATTKFNINMFINNEHSLNVIKDEKVIEYKKFDVMWSLFRIHLFISGVLAIETNSSSRNYPKEYEYWMREIKKERWGLLSSNLVPLHSKIRIIAASSFPKIWSKLAEYKRKKIFQESV